VWGLPHPKKVVSEANSFSLVFSVALVALLFIKKGLKERLATF